MIWRPDRARSVGLPADSEAGFTLIEMIVVIAILGLMIALIGIDAKPVSPATHARAAAEEISGAMRAARSFALMSNRSVEFTLDLALHNYQWGMEPPRPLSGDIRLSLLTGRDQAISGTQGRIRFDPDGGSSGGRVSINGGGQLWWVGVDWLSGRVTVAKNSD